MIHRDGRFLLGRRSAQRSYYPGVWDVFGGHVHDGEEPASALARELLEELDIVPLSPEKRSVIQEPNPALHGPGEFHVFLVTRWTGELVAKGEEHDLIGWFTLDEAARLELADRSLLAVLEDSARRIVGHSMLLP